jgi:alpha-mannosidase
VAAAQAAARQDVETARAHLAQCFETLYEARKRFYPVDVYLIDLMLLAPTTLGPALARELTLGTPTNLLATMEVLSTLANNHPTQWSSLLSAIDSAKACVLGGEEEERALPLLPLEAARASLAAGVRGYEALLGRQPHVYGRRRAGLWPALPQILVKLGYQGALGFTLDDGRFPLGPQSKTRWEGLDTSTIDILCQVPADAAKAETFLGLSRTMADSMDNNHVATVAFAHWPGASSAWYEILRRIARLSPVLGKFTLLDDYFSHTDMPGRLSKFEPDQYRTPYLKQAIPRRQSDPISAFVRAHHWQARCAAVQTIATLVDLLAGKSSGGESVCRELDDQVQPAEHEPDALAAGIERLAATLPRASGPAAPRQLVANPLSFARRIGIELAGSANPPAVAAAIAAGSADTRQFAVVDVPALGFAWVDPAGPAAALRGAPIARENVLANEFFELTVSKHTGGIQSIYSVNHRGNQLSQQIAFRLASPPAEPGAPWRDPDEDAAYTTMRAESVEITASSPAFGEITSRGALVDAEGRRRAGFRQSTQLWAGSRVVRVDIELDAIEEPRADPWNSYYAARFAWPDDAAELWRGVSLSRRRTDASRLEAPEYIDIESPTGRVTILTGGLPYHRRVGSRMLDSLLAVRGERQRQFTVGIGIDLTQPAAAALEFITPPTVYTDRGPPGTSTSGWLFHVDAKNVLATHWEPLVDDQAGEPSLTEQARPIKGFRARLLETAGRPGRVALRTYRAVAHARQVDFLAQTLLEAPVEADKIMLDFAAGEWIEVEAVWSA